MSVLRESDDGRISRGAASCHASLNSGSGVFLGLETSELCCDGGPGREGSAQLGRRGVAAGEEGVLLGAENRIHF